MMLLASSYFHKKAHYKCLRRPYPFKFFKGCLPQNLLSPLLNTLSQIFVMLLILIQIRLTLSSTPIYTHAYV